MPPNRNRNRNTIELIGVEDPKLGHPVQFLGPPPSMSSRTVQFFRRGGSMHIQRVAAMLMGALYSDPTVYELTQTPDGIGTLAILADPDEASSLHGNVLWVANTLACCLQVSPDVAFNSRAARVTPIVRLYVPDP